MTLYVQIEGLESLTAALGTVPGEVEKQNRAVMHTAVVLVQKEAQKRIYSPEGRARSGIKADVTDKFGDSIIGRIRSRNTAAVWSQKTRSPERPQPPVSRIRSWMRRQGFYPSAAEVFLIARSIGRKGKPGQPVMADSMEATRAEVTLMFRAALTEIVRSVVMRGGKRR